MVRKSLTSDADISGQHVMQIMNKYFEKIEKN